MTKPNLKLLVPENEREIEPTSKMTVFWAVVLVSIPLGFCCYYFLQ